MKRLLIILVMMFTSVSIYAESGDLFSTGQNGEFRINSDGDPITSNGLGFDVTWIDPPSSSSQTFTGTAGAMISTATLVASGTTFVEGATYAAGTNKFLQISFPRNIVCQVGFLYGAATTTVTGTLTVSGKDGLGVSTTEAIAISTKTAAVDGIGVKAWSWVDSFAFSGMAISGACGQAQGGSGTSVSTCTIHIGVGSKLGLGYDITASTDISKVSIGYVDYSTASYKLNGANPDYDTINLIKYGNELIPDGSRDYRIRGKALKKH